jgi:hypothetical protein
MQKLGLKSLKGTDQSGRPTHSWKIISKKILREYGGKV